MSNEVWDEKQGRDLIREWRRSGESMAAFARSRGVSAQRLRYWRVRLEQHEADRRLALAGPRLVPGVVVDIERSASVGITLPRGVIVEARRAADVDPTWLADVVRALEALP